MRLLLVEAKRRLYSLAGAIEGYDQPALVEEVFQKTRLYEPSHDWPEMAGASSVLDFGGACGQHYKVAVRSAPDIRWAVVETKAMAERASELATDRLRFFSDIDKAADWLGPIDVMHSDGALHFTSDPLDNLKRLCSLRAKAMHWNRTPLSSKTTRSKVNYSLLGENGPGAVKRFTGRAVKYPTTIIPEKTFMECHSGYVLADRGADRFRFSLI